MIHPLASIELPHRDGIANAFEWSAEARTIEAKYGNGVEDLRLLYKEFSGAMINGSGSARGYAHDTHRAIGA